MVILLALLFWQSPPAPKPGPFGSDPRYVNRYFENAYPEGDVIVPASGRVKIVFPAAFVSHPSCIYTGAQMKEVLDPELRADYITLKAEPGTLHYKCTGLVRRKVKAGWDGKRWVCEPGWRPYDSMADEEHPQACLEAWDGNEVPKEARPDAAKTPHP